MSVEDANDTIMEGVQSLTSLLYSARIQTASSSKKFFEFWEPVNGARFWKFCQEHFQKFCKKSIIKDNHKRIFNNNFQQIVLSTLVSM